MPGFYGIEDMFLAVGAFLYFINGLILLMNIVSCNSKKWLFITWSIVQIVSILMDFYGVAFTSEDLTSMWLMTSINFIMIILDIFYLVVVINYMKVKEEEKKNSSVAAILEEISLLTVTDYEHDLV